MNRRDLALGLMWGFAAGMAAEVALGRLEAASHLVKHPPERTIHVPTGVDVQRVEQHDPRLGRIKVHDERSRGFPARLVVDRSTWHDKAIRVYDPIPNPNQTVGNCTTCAKAVQLNTVGNRRTGVVLNMTWAMDAYVWETANDEFPGQMPDQDTGSSGLASCKTAQHTGDGGAYYWLFGGADEVVQSIMAGRAPSLGTWWYQCVVPETRVLTPSLEWVPIGKVSVGDGLIGFDEHAKRGSRYRHAEVVSADRIVSPCYEVVTDRGTVVASADHRFVWSDRSRGRQWRTTVDLRPGNRLAYFGDPWEVDRSWEAGWLAGFYDGEGSLQTYVPGRPNGNLLTVAQKPGPTLDRALAYLSARGFDYGTRVKPSSNVVDVYLRGENAKNRFLGSIRPGRLLAVSERAWLDHLTWNKVGRYAVVQEVRPVGQQEVVAVGTTTGTLITEGLLSHNSMFSPDAAGTIHPTGGQAGGHQYVARGYDAYRDRVMLRCWWGGYRDVWITRADLDGLLRDDGDAHFQVRA